MSNTAKPLSGKNALVTGGSRGIGAAIARRLAADGANVAISYSASEAAANGVIKDIEALGVKGLAIKADQAAPAQVHDMVGIAAKKFGGLDILVNNAGVFAMGAVEGDRTGMDRMQAINVGGVVAAVRAASPFLRDGGRIVNIGSVVGDRTPFAGAADYSATKAAVGAYSRGWAQDFAPRNITVNTVQPGPIATDMNPDDGDFAAAQRASIPLRRYGKPEEIAGAVAFLAGPDASYVTGATLNVDGGFNA